jgi:ABC-2 type transport system ATP-binding protein
MNLAIETENLGKLYGNVRAVENLSLRVTEGEIYVFLGLNGAGKTTTIRMLLGMIKPTTGSAHMLGTRVRLGKREPWARVGYLVEMPQAYPELTVRDNLEAARRLHPGTKKQVVENILNRMSLVPYADRKAGTLSQGNAQRLGLAKALLHDPKLIILDEPANGLDPAGIVEIRELLTRLAHQEGVTVFMSSHILAEVARLADRIGIIHEGRLIQELNRDELEHKRNRRLLIKVGDVEKARKMLVQSGFPSEVLPGGILQLKGEKAVAHPDRVATLLVQSKTPPTQLLVEEEELERYFLRLVGVNGGEQ